jgi:hypothetical protein
MSTGTSTTTFTQRPLELKDYIQLIGTGPTALCKKLQPIECNQKKNSLEVAKACEELFRECLRETRLFEQWSRRN